MSLNLTRGCWRLWLFFTLVWVSVCAWQVYDANAQVTKATALLSYYQKSATEARALVGTSGVSPFVSAQLSEQVSLNEKTIAEQRARSEKFFRWVWMIPAVTLIFALGIPWVSRGFVD